MTKTRGSTALAFAISSALVMLASCGREMQDPEVSESSAAIPAPPSAARPLPDSAFQVEWTRLDMPSAMAARKTVSVTVTFKNKSPNTWPDPKHANPAKPDGAYAVRLAYRWWKRGASIPVSDYDQRIDLAAPVQPGQSAALVFTVRAPSEPGEYSLQFDLVNELVAWFEKKGADKALIPIKVS